ncbi:hypothetical protein [Thioclava sp.]|uniref:hypothetical protein n=1 Tax=Thioclava sp. TaxID=1933450 RepID=UPI003AA7AE4F
MVRSTGALHHPRVLIALINIWRVHYNVFDWRPIPFPNEEPYTHKVMVNYLQTAGLFVIVTTGSDTVHVSTDFEHFEPIISQSVMKDAVAPLPDRAALLLVGSDGLYTFEAECPVPGD